MAPLCVAVKKKIKKKQLRLLHRNAAKHAGGSRRGTYVPKKKYESFDADVTWFLSTFKGKTGKKLKDAQALPSRVERDSIKRSMTASHAFTTKRWWRTLCLKASFLVETRPLMWVHPRGCAQPCQKNDHFQVSVIVLHF